MSNADLDYRNLSYEDRELARRCIGVEWYKKLSDGKKAQSMIFLRKRGYEWKYIKPNGVVFYDNKTVEITLGIGETWSIHEAPEYSTRDMRRAINRVSTSEDLIMSEVLGGFDTPIGRFRSLMFVRYVHRSTEKWQRLQARLKRW